jgi:HAD superfamily hydrolase (TIGR01490 family)
VSEPLEIAIYDFDRTLTRSGSYTPFLISWVVRRAPWRLLLVPLVAIVMAGNPLGLVSRDRLKAIMLALLLGKPDRAVLAAHVDWFARWFMARQLRPGAAAQLAQDKAAGRVLVLATASFRFYAEPIGRSLGFDHVVATEVQRDRYGRVRAALDGPNCYGPHKVAMLAPVLEAIRAGRPARQWAYTDHHSDAPLLAQADHPLAVNPNAKLTRLAQARGWPIADWG